MCPYINIFGRTIPTYGLCIVLAAIVCFSFAIWRAKKKQVLIEDVFIVLASGCGFAIIGAKLLYLIVTYSLEDIINFIKNGDFSFLEGSGLVFLGGLICSIIGAWIGSLLAKRKLADFEALIVPIIPVGHAIGRIGCLMAGCCYGKLYDGPFAVHYRNWTTGEWTVEGYFPIQLLEALLNCVMAVVLYIRSNKKHPEYFLLLDYLMYYSITRFFLEFLRGDAERGIYDGFSTSQWISIGLLLITIVIRIVKKCMEVGYGKKNFKS